MLQTYQTTCIKYVSIILSYRYEMSKDMVTSLRINFDLWKRARIYSIENNISVKQLLETLIERELKEKRIEKELKKEVI